MSQLPFIFDGACMLCKNKSPPSEMLTCGKCTTPWHLSCLSSLSHTHWHCPSCSHHQPNNPHLNCSICLQLPQKPVSTPSPGVPSKVTTTGTSNIHQHHHVGNQDRPDTAFTTERAKRSGKANACSGNIFSVIGLSGLQSSDEHGDRPRPLPEIAELNGAADDITGRKGNPSWDYDEEKGCWLWKKPPPKSKKSVHIKSEDETTVRVKQKVENVSVNKSLSNEFCCQICRKVMSSPLTTPFAYNFCKTCLEGAFAGQSFIRNKACLDGRTLQAQKNIMKCPSCSNDIADFLQNPQVNREMMGTIESLQHQEAEQDENSEKSSDKNDKNLHDAAEVSNPSDSSEKVLEEIKDFDLNKPPK